MISPLNFFLAVVTCNFIAALSILLIMNLVMFISDQRYYKEYFAIVKRDRGIDVNEKNNC
jgi:hypothetical protein